MALIGRQGVVVPIEIFEQIDENQLQKLIEAFNEARFPISSTKPSEVVSLFHKVTDIPAEEDIMLFFGIILSLLNDSGSVESVSKNIKMLLGALSADEELKRKIIFFLDSLKYKDQFFLKRRLDAYKTRANVYFLTLSYVCDLRGRFKEDYDYNESNVEEYTPEVEDVVPLASLKFSVSDGNERKDSSFQVEEKELDEIISSLLAAQKELKALNKFLQGEKNVQKEKE